MRSNSIIIGDLTEHKIVVGALDGSYEVYVGEYDSTNVEIDFASNVTINYGKASLADGLTVDSNALAATSKSVYDLNQSVGIHTNDW